MDSLNDLLGRKKVDEPPEVQVIKQFLKDNFKAECQVDLRQKQIIVIVASASLAGALRLRLHELQALCQSSRRLMIRIS